MITTIIGFMALVSSFRSFFDEGLWGIGVLASLILGLIGAYIWVFLRIVYWTECANCAIHLSNEKVIRLFNEVNQNPEANERYYEEPPNTAILQNAIGRFFTTSEGFPWLKRQAVRTAGVHTFKRQ